MELRFGDPLENLWKTWHVRLLRGGRLRAAQFRVDRHEHADDRRRWLEETRHSSARSFRGGNSGPGGMGSVCREGRRKRSSVGQRQEAVARASEFIAFSPSHCLTAADRSATLVHQEYDEHRKRTGRSGESPATEVSRGRFCPVRRPERRRWAPAGRYERPRPGRVPEHETDRRGRLLECLAARGPIRARLRRRSARRLTATGFASNR